MTLATVHSSGDLVTLQWFDDCTLSDRREQHSLQQIANIVSLWICDLQREQKDLDDDKNLACICYSWCEIVNEWLGHVGASLHRLLVVKIGQKVAGILALEMPKNAPNAWVSLLGVAAEHREHHGIGTILLAAACGKAQREGCSELSLFSYRLACGFYEKMGMKRHITDHGQVCYRLLLGRPLSLRLQSIAFWRIVPRQLERSNPPPKRRCLQ